MARDLLLRGMLAGVLAGLLAFGFATLFGEPPLELAIGREAAGGHAGGHAMEPELVSRSVQRGLGLLTACVMTGVALGGVLALAFAFAYRRIGRLGPTPLAVLLGAAGFIVVVLVPQLKYPASPPLLGVAASIGQRTALYFEMMVIALGAMLLAILFARRLVERLGGWSALLVGAAAFAANVVTLQFALPGIDEVAGDFPAGLLWRFRLASLGTQFVMWASLAAVFSVLARRSPGI